MENVVRWYLYRKMVGDMKKYCIGLIAVVCFFIGCQSVRLDQYYQPSPAGLQMCEPYGGSVNFKQVHPTKLKSSIWALTGSDYWSIGHMTFEGPDIGNQRFMDFAESKGADVALFTKTYLRTDKSVSPVVMPTMNTSTTYIPSSVGGSSVGHMVDTTTQGSTTVNLKKSTAVYKYFLMLFRKVIPSRRLRIGAIYLPLNEEQARQAGTHKGVVIVKVLKNRPAWDADLVEGDIVLYLDDKQVLESESFRSMLHQAEGKHKLTIVRGAEKIVKEINIPPVFSRDER